MKKGAYTIGSMIILLLCAFVFVLLPALTGGESYEELPAFGKYDGKEIRYEQGSDMQTFVTQYAQMFESQGQNLDASMNYYIFNYAFNSAVSKAAFTSEAEDAHYKVPRQSINRALSQYFAGEDGKYDQKAYRLAVAQNASAVEEMRKQLEEGLTAARYQYDNFGSDEEILASESLYGLKESDAELDFLNSFGNTKRGFNMAVFSLSDYPDEEKVKFGEANKAKFVTYDMSIFTTGEKSEAEKVSKRIANGEITFEDAVSELSSKNYSDSEGKLTNKLQYQIENILNDKADIAKITDLKTGNLSEVIQTTSGFSIFRSDAEPVQPDFTASETISTVSTYMNTYESGTIENYYTAKATDFTAEVIRTDFDTACAVMNVNNVEIKPFPLNYGSATITESVDTSLPGLSGADTNENFLTKAFSLELNELSEPIVIGRNVVVLQFTMEENDTVESEENPVTLEQLNGYDTECATDFVMNNPKLENNFAEVYFNNLMTN